MANTSRLNLHLAEDAESFNPLTQLNDNWDKLDNVILRKNWLSYTSTSDLETLTSALPNGSVTIAYIDWRIINQDYYDENWGNTFTGPVVIYKYDSSNIMIKGGQHAHFERYMGTMVSYGNIIAMKVSNTWKYCLHRYVNF